ncbi:MAG: STAS domain-containing protein [Proteobacteria bacterium]|nr:STAS domain-containing protein [Pseudomonadota bacterium]
MNITKELLDGSLKLKIDGEVTIQHAEEIKSALIEAARITDSLDLCISNATDIDIAGLQLICAAHRTLKDLNKQFTISPGSIPEALKETIKVAGYHRNKGCFVGSDNACPLKE